MQQMPLVCFLSLIRPPGISFEDSFLQILPVDKSKCPFVRDHSDITIRLYTRHNPTVYQELQIDDDESLFASHIDFHDPTVLYFSAFLEMPDDGSGLLVRESYMMRGDTNFIIFDLSRLEAGPWYFTAAENTWYIGNFAAKFIDYLVSRGLDLKKTHLVGHSLGAQSAGVAGYAIKSGRINRITGLDPAFPLFDKLPLTQRLDPSDAEFVDVIHTDAGIFGFNRPTGHVDFYPNGGISPQPGCELEVVIPEQRIINKSTGVRTNSTQSRLSGPTRLWRRAAPPGARTGAANVRGGTIYTWDTRQTDSEGDEKPRGFYLFTLNTNETQTSLNEKFQKFFDNINKMKKLNVNINNGKDIDKYAKDNKKLVSDIEKRKLYKLNKTLKRHNDEKIHLQKKYSEQHKIITLDSTSDESDLDLMKYDKTTSTFKREKRVSNTQHDDSKYSEVNLEYSKYKSKNNEKVVLEAQDTKASDTIDSAENTGNKNFKKHQNLSEFMETEKDFDIKALKRKSSTEEQLGIENTPSTITLEQDSSKTDKESKLMQTLRRPKRFISFFKNNDDNFLFRMLEFLMKNRGKVIPVVTVMREISTLVKSANGELNHSSKERNNYIGAPPPAIPITYDLEIGNESRITALIKRFLGLGVKGGKLTINGSG